jgi:hypothetical protein
LRRGVGTLLTEVVQLQDLSPLGDDADGANADTDAAADRLILVTPAGDDSQRPTVSFVKEDDCVMELEQLVHRPQGDVIDLFEIERRVNLGGHTLQNL